MNFYSITTYHYYFLFIIFIVIVIRQLSQIMG